MSRIIPPFAAANYIPIVESTASIKCTGKVSQILGLTIEGDGPAVNMGEYCLIKTKDGELLPSEVVGFKSGRVILMPLGEVR